MRIKKTGLRLNNYYLLLKKAMTLFLPIYVNLTSNKQYPVEIWQPYMVVISMLKIICLPVHEQWVVFAWVSSKPERSRDLIVCFESKRRQIKPKIKQHRKLKRWATRTYQKPEHISGACEGRAVFPPTRHPPWYSYSQYVLDTTIRKQTQIT